MILPKTRFAIHFDSFAHVILVYLVTVTLSIAAGYGLRAYSLHHVSAFYQDRVAVLSPAVLSDRELRAVYDVAVADLAARDRLAVAGMVAPLLAYVIPLDWHLPDLPIDSHEVVIERGGHGAPADFDRRYYKVLFTQVRTHDPDARGDDIVKKAFGKDPVLLLKVDMEEKRVSGFETFPPHVVWGDIPGPMF